MQLRVEPYDGPAAARLVAEVQQEYVTRYGGPDGTPVDPVEFAPPLGCFVVGYLNDEPVASGGFRRLDDDRVEIKRMYVVPAHRGKGLARLMLAHLEQLAREVGASQVLLETGSRQPEAIALYESSGYVPVSGFGHYAGEELSHGFRKSLRP